MTDAGRPAVPGSADAGDHLSDAARRYLHRSMAASTRRAYDGGWRLYLAWCTLHGHAPTDDDPRRLAARVADWTAAEADRGMAPSTIAKRLAGVGKVLAHLTGSDPTRAAVVRDVLKGARRGRRPPRKKAELTPADIRRLVGEAMRGHGSGAAATLLALRDRALVLVGFHGALRASDLQAVHADHIAIDERGAILVLSGTKGDRAATGVSVGLPRAKRPEHCPVVALQAWMAAAGLRHGPVFRRVHPDGRLGRAALSYPAIRKRLRTLLRAAGMPAEAIDRLGTHSLRVGWLNSAMRKQRQDAGTLDLPALMQHGRWRKTETVRDYERRATIWDDHPGVGLLDDADDHR